jgi:hypothetical protein
LRLSNCLLPHLLDLLELLLFVTLPLCLLQRELRLVPRQLSPTLLHQVELFLNPQVNLSLNSLLNTLALLLQLQLVPKRNFLLLLGHLLCHSHVKLTLPLQLQECLSMLQLLCCFNLQYFGLLVKPNLILLFYLPLYVKLYFL